MQQQQQPNSTVFTIPLLEQGVNSIQIIDDLLDDAPPSLMPEEESTSPRAERSASLTTMLTARSFLSRKSLSKKPELGMIKATSFLTGYGSLDVVPC